MTRAHRRRVIGRSSVGRRCGRPYGGGCRTAHVMNRLAAQHSKMVPATAPAQGFKWLRPALGAFAACGVSLLTLKSKT